MFNVQLQKPTRKISDTWIIDTDKRETRYQLVKVHQTIRQPHKVSYFINHAWVTYSNSAFTKRPFFDNVWYALMHACMLSHFSHVQLFATQWVVARQTPLCIEFSRKEYWSRLPGPPPGDLPNPEIEPASFKSLTLVDCSLPLVPPGKPHLYINNCFPT